MTTNPHNDTPSVSHAGLMSGIIAYTIWGLFPIYFKLTADVSAIEILVHRIVWSVPFGFVIILARKQLGEVWTALKDKKVVLMLALAAVSLAGNWGVYIWAIQQNFIFQASLGYYINPLIYMLVGVVFFQDKLSRLQAFAVALATIGVLILVIYGGVIPYISLFLAISFTIYGVIRKQINVGAMPGLFIETLLLLPLAMIYIVYTMQMGTFMFTQSDLTLQGLLLLAGPVTVLPLVAFAFAARNLRLSTLGFLQYIGPTLQFICAIYYGEAFTPAHAGCFAFIWAAVLVYSWGAYLNRPKKALASQTS